MQQTRIVFGRNSVVANAEPRSHRLRCSEIQSVELLENVRKEANKGEGRYAFTYSNCTSNDRRWSCFLGSDLRPRYTLSPRYFWWYLILLAYMLSCTLFSNTTPPPLMDGYHLRLCSFFTKPRPLQENHISGSKVNFDKISPGRRTDPGHVPGFSCFRSKITPAETTWRLLYRILARFSREHPTHSWFMRSTVCCRVR
jgi:hypothetical protein